MPTNKVAENVFGTLGSEMPHYPYFFTTHFVGTICWSAQLVPQVWKSYREKSTAGLSAWLVLCWGISGGFLGVYAVVQNLNVPLIVQPQLFGLLCLISWGQCQYYGSTRPKYLSLIIAVSAIIALGGFETAMVFAIRPSQNHRAIQFFGIFSSVLLSLGLVTQYHEIYKRREVVGLSITFMTVDLLGGVFSDLSLAFKPKFDAIATITYSLVVVMDGAVILAAIILNPRAGRRRHLEDTRDTRDNRTDENVTEIDTVPVTPSQRRTSSAAQDHWGRLHAE
ncbi:hypothetical protein B0H11DRAFT_1865312 [Mycena galericulata]|nr:hypothetical protein B0H11DRAFT_1865312 [Mycena galericulata]